MDRPDDAVLTFLQNPTSYGAKGPVTRVDTHAAIVFLVGSRAFKLKKPVKFPFLDYSTLALRRAAIMREFQLNHPNAPQIYLGVRVLVRGHNGDMRIVAADAIPKDAVVMEWLLEMVRFDEAATLDHLCRAGPLAAELVNSLARVIVAAEMKAEIRDVEPWIADLETYIHQNDEAFRAEPGLFRPDCVRSLRDAAKACLVGIRALLRARGHAGFIRLTHGDLHTGNIAVIDGAPVLFDAIEFDDRIATGDILYDVGFLLMDLDERGQTMAANRVLNRWLIETARAAVKGPNDCRTAIASALRDQAAGLAALPLFLMMRAAIRAKVTAGKIASLKGEAIGEATREARRYFEIAARHLQPVKPVLIAIGGLSGTGKSTLAARLAPLIGHSPGALHLRSDQIRKALEGIAELEPLAPEAYTPESSKAVYDVVGITAAAALAAGWSVVIDMVAARPDEREALEALAQKCGARFIGLWLDAPQAILTERVAARTGDASDADARVVRFQAGIDLGEIDWNQIDAGGTADDTFARACTLLDPGNR